MNRKIDLESTYTDKLISLIPGEIVAAYFAIRNIIIDFGIPLKYWQKEAILTGTVVILTCMTGIYLFKLNNVRSLNQIVVTCISFIMWAVYISAKDEVWFSISPAFTLTALVLWTLFIPVLLKGREG